MDDERLKKRNINSLRVAIRMIQQFGGLIWGDINPTGISEEITLK